VNFGAVTAEFTATVYDTEARPGELTPGFATRIYTVAQNTSIFLLFE